MKNVRHSLTHSLTHIYSAGMMFWAVGILCFAHKNMEVNGGNLQLGMAINVALQLIYITKFFYWEMGYMCSMVCCLLLLAC